jgi:hypothetical protein
MLVTPPVLASETELRVTLGGVTLSVKAGELVTPPATAVRFTEPTATPVARPDLLMVTMLVLLVFQLETELP